MPSFTTCHRKVEKCSVDLWYLADFGPGMVGKMILLPCYLRSYVFKRFMLTFYFTLRVGQLTFSSADSASWFGLISFLLIFRLCWSPCTCFSNNLYSSILYLKNAQSLSNVISYRVLYIICFYWHSYYHLLCSIVPSHISIDAP